jgi:predicted dehydrogenase
MQYHSRRRFIKYTTGGVLATALSQQYILGANSRVRLGLIACGNRAKEHFRYFSNLPNCDIVAISDPDTAQMDRMLKKYEAQEWFKRPDKIQDYRKLLERDDIDGVVIVSPNYWHALHSIHALEAGKHVYVEKPVTFSLWEGLQVQAAEKKYSKLMYMGGFQNRSDPGPQKGIQFVQEGKLGKIKRIRSLCFRNRNSIGRQDKPLTPPQTMDYDLWLGPAEDRPIFRPRIHYDWHWDFNTGNGDIGNQGPHEIDLLCWVLGDKTLPTSIQSFGGRFGWDDAGNTPNMQLAHFEVDGVECLIEVNDLRISPERNVAANRMGVRVGIIVECEKGILKGGRGGMTAVENDGKTVIQKFPGNGGRTHYSDFVEAIRNGNRDLLKSNIPDAQKSSSLAHLANVSYRMGETMDTLPARFRDHEAIGEIVSEQARQLKSWGIENPKYVVGPEIRINPESQTVTTRDVPGEFVGPHYRKGYEVPKLA